MISYHQIDTHYGLTKKRAISRWIHDISNEYNKKVGEISIIFCSDEHLLSMNQEYLKHNTLTDIITFDYGNSSMISGDLFISIDRVKENAKKLQIETKEEVHRVIIHGVLHLLGFQDKTSEMKKNMRALEDSALNKRSAELLN